MRAVIVNDYGESPVVAEMPTPKPGAGQVLIREQAAGMNPTERGIAAGLFAALLLSWFIAGNLSGLDLDSPMTFAIVGFCPETHSRRCIGSAIFSFRSEIVRWPTSPFGDRLSPASCTYWSYG